VKLVKLWEEQTKVKKEIKEAKAELIDKTKEAIEHLTDEEVELFLHKKWIDPVVAGINDTLTDVLKAVETRVTALANKYAVSYKELGEQMAEAKQQMADLVADLTGDEYALEGLRNLN
jgi:type I restriction enzyme M protein